MNKNIIVLDSLRAFAAISVCLFHFVCTTQGYITNQLALDIFSIGKYGVQLFFVISGFVIPWAMYNAKFEFKSFFPFLLKRLARLEPPYIVSIALAIFVLVIRSFIYKTPLDEIASVKQIIFHFGYLIPFFDNYKWLNQVYWTLAIEFQYYFFIAFFFIPFVKSKLVARGFIYLSVLLVSYIGTSSFLPYWLPVFLIGIVLFLYKAKIIKVLEYSLVTALILVFCFMKYPIPSVFFMILPVFAVIFYSDLKIRYLNFFGQMSYSIYLIHPIIGATFINIMSHNIQSSIGKVLLIATGFLITLIGAYLTFILVEKPSKKLSSSIKYF